MPQPTAAHPDRAGLQHPLPAGPGPQIAARRCASCCSWLQKKGRRIAALAGGGEVGVCRLGAGHRLQCIEHMIEQGGSPFTHHSCTRSSCRLHPRRCASEAWLVWGFNCTPVSRRDASSRQHALELRLAHCGRLAGAGWMPHAPAGRFKTATGLAELGRVMPTCARY